MVCSPSADSSSQIILSPACISNYARLLFRPSKKSIHDMTWLPPTRSYHISKQNTHIYARPKTIPSVVPDFIVIPFIPHSPSRTFLGAIPAPLKIKPGSMFLRRPDFARPVPCQPPDQPTLHRCVLHHIGKCLDLAPSLISSAFVFFYY